MDQTAFFKACIKTIKTKNKALGSKVQSKGNTILPSSKQKSEFSLKAKNVLNSITKLKVFLLDHRKEYINVLSHLSCEVSTMTDQERDQIDTDAQTFMRTCHSAIRTLRQEASEKNASNQVSLHREAILEILDTYLKAVCKLYSEQRAIRIKKVVDKKRMSRLQPEMKKNKEESITTPAPPKLSIDEPETSPDPGPEIDQKLTAEEAQMFEQENKALFDQMNSLVDEVRSIEGKVVEISKLQEIFSEKVLHQSEQVEKIHHKVVGTTENVQEGNEQIREAIKNNAGFRVWILFFLVMCSFSLLFLDWYS